MKRKTMRMRWMVKTNSAMRIRRARYFRKRSLRKKKIIRKILLNRILSLVRKNQSYY
jgi:hypothetical protein